MHGAAARWTLGRSAAAVLLILGALAFPSSAGAFLYWGSFQSNSIARADLDGSQRRQQFIRGIDAPSALDVTRSNVYWANFGSGAIGRASLDGTHAKPEFIVG